MKRSIHKMPAVISIFVLCAGATAMGQDVTRRISEEAGDYFSVCDMHPRTMTGTFVVTE